LALKRWPKRVLHIVKTLSTIAAEIDAPTLKQILLEFNVRCDRFTYSLDTDGKKFPRD